MFVIKRTESNVFTVGHYNPSGEWIPASDHPTSDEAQRQCAWLNGSPIGENKNDPVKIVLVRDGGNCWLFCDHKSQTLVMNYEKENFLSEDDTFTDLKGRPYQGFIHSQNELAWSVERGFPYDVQTIFQNHYDQLEENE